MGTTSEWIEHAVDIDIDIDIDIGNVDIDEAPARLLRGEQPGRAPAGGSTTGAAHPPPPATRRKFGWH